MKRPSVLPNGLRLTGDIEGDEDLVVAGAIEGEVRIDGMLVIDPSGIIRGDVAARAVTIRGVVVGNVQAAESIRVDEGGRIVGDLEAPRVSLVEGALFRGKLKMTGSGAAPALVREARPAYRSHRPLPAETVAGATSPGTLPATATLAASHTPTSPGGLPAAAAAAAAAPQRPSRAPIPVPILEAAEREPVAPPAPPAERVRVGPPVPTFPVIQRQKARRKDTERA